jgi:2'-5' RNA ligase
MIQSIYDKMWGEFCAGLSQNQYELDPHIYSSNDTRRGITALAYLNSNCQCVSQEIANFLAQAKVIEPQQYYHPLNELHLTVLSIISCFEGFRLSDIDQQRYADIFSDAMASVEPIEVKFQGVTASSSCIVIQGFPIGSGLSDLRHKLRNEFKESGLKSTIDSRYKLVTAHSSAIRFCSPLQNSSQLLTLCKQYKNHNFGSATFTNFELVFNNWYQNLSVKQNLAEHSIGRR